MYKNINGTSLIILVDTVWWNWLLYKSLWPSWVYKGRFKEETSYNYNVCYILKKQQRWNKTT